MRTNKLVSLNRTAGRSSSLFYSGYRSVVGHAVAKAALSRTLEDRQAAAQCVGDE